jgi:hypothetical protein
MKFYLKNIPGKLVENWLRNNLNLNGRKNLIANLRRCISVSFVSKHLMHYSPIVVIIYLYSLCYTSIDLLDGLKKEHPNRYKVIYCDEESTSMENNETDEEVN